jgi:nucleotide-binding universal stress UspA family protein
MPPSQSLPAKAVVVGIDASGPAHSALLWAAREAKSRELPLVVCHAYAPTDGEPDWEAAGSARNRAWRIATEGAHAANLASPGGEAYAHAAPGPIQYVLRTAVADPEVFVLGCHRRQESRQQRRGRLPVVLAVDGSSAVRSALPFALAAAAIRRTRVVVLPVAGKDNAATGNALAGFERLARSRPGVPVVLLDELPIGGPIARLIRAADHAGLLVAPTAQGRLLGSKLAQFAIGRARCPIALVPRRT